jgi:hypothetical protein
VGVERRLAVPLLQTASRKARFKHRVSSNLQLAKYILVGLELPPSQRSPRQGREAELSPLQGAQKEALLGWCRVSRFKHSSNPQLAKYILVGLELPPSQRSPRQGREAELSPLQGAQKRPCSGVKFKLSTSSSLEVLHGEISNWNIILQQRGSIINLSTPQSIS